MNLKKYSVLIVLMLSISVLAGCGDGGGGGDDDTADTSSGVINPSNPAYILDGPPIAPSRMFSTQNLTKKQTITVNLKESGLVDAPINSGVVLSGIECY